MSMRSKFNLLDAGDLTVPLFERGLLWYDDQIPDQFFRGRVTVRWVRAHLPRNKGLKIGRGWAWYEADILAWLEAQRGAGRVA